nr:hypothetical protein [Tanacetum cinerariifolium]
MLKDAPILSTREPENSLSMGYEHLIITPETESDEVTESNAENLLPIPNECEVALEDKRECDLLIYENSPVYNNSDTFFNSEINDDISVYDDDFENIEYVEASLLNPAIVSVEEENSDNSLLDNFSPEFETFCDRSEETRSGNTTHVNYSLPEYDLFCFEIEPDQESDNTTTHANYSLPEYDSFRFEIKPNQEELFSVVMIDIPDNSSNDPLLEEVDLFLSDDSISPGIENFADDPEGDIR